MRQGEGFLVSSMRPAMFLRKRLCMFFSSMCRNLMPLGALQCATAWRGSPDMINGWQEEEEDRREAGKA